MAGFRPKTGEKNIPSTPIPTKTCKKCSRSWTEEHFRDKRGAPTQLCLQCRDASNKSHKRRRERESLKANLRVDIPAPPGPRAGITARICQSSTLSLSIHCSVLRSRV
ncbi:uncharacterized protein BDW70DRAFT_154234 [Aspergillus foveolatus]|uniref:uncharacterized protein n=1 Tax=Aspergillus foveolatus TaxID=210207 RepID=UPI003CCDC19C